jgi:hypothetical protein
MFIRCFVILLVVLAGGCSSTLETGYKPRKLNSSQAERRAYYAAPFSPEARGEEQRSQMPPPSGRY